MTCQRALKAHVFGVVSLLITTLVILLALGAPAQLTGSGHPSAKLTVVLTPQAASQPLFLPAVTYDSGGIFAASMAVGDVNGDGKLDLAVSNIYNGALTFGSVGVLLGKGDGTFEATVAYDSGGYGTGSVAVADVNDDGKRDLLVANECATPFSSGACDSNGSVGVLLGNGDGTSKRQ
jgi:FG-GAP-like repeat